jgi:hypothetical protein
LKPTDIKLKTFSGELINLVGLCEMAVQQERGESMLPLVVTPGVCWDVIGYKAVAD